MNVLIAAKWATNKVLNNIAVDIFAASALANRNNPIMRVKTTPTGVFLS